MRHVTDEERRARLGTRHALASRSRVETPEAVTSALTVLHSTEPSTVHLACRARSRAVEIEDVERALYSDRRLVRQLAMRRTLFVFPRDLLSAAWGSASARVAETQRRRMVKDIVDAGIDRDGERWLERARAEVLEVLSAHPQGLTAGELRKEAPRIAVKVEPPTGEPWSAARLLTYLGARADVVRGGNTGDWQVSRPLWTLTRDWLDEDPGRMDAADGYRELVRRWLGTFGPGSEEDMVWWVALLPILDPTVMGWRGRDFYLGPHAGALFDTAGNAGTTVWVDGRVVGCWVQDDAGTVEPRLLVRVPARALRSLRSAAAELTAWLDGTRIRSPLRSPAMRAGPP